METEQTIEEYYLDKIKGCLLFDKDEMAIRFLEKYHQAKADKNKELENILNTFIKTIL